MSYERDKLCNAGEPEGSYGCCWKFITPDDPGSLRCVREPEHDGECSPEEAEDG